MKRAAVDLNSLLRIANAVIAVVLAHAWWTVDASREVNAYIDGSGLACGLLLCLQTEIVLILERRRRDPFVMLIAFGMIFYYELRLYTLHLYPFSLVFDRFGYSAADTLRAVIYIFLANFALYAGAWLVPHREPELAIDATRWRADAPLTVIMVMLVTFLLAYFSGNFFTSDNVPRAITVVTTLLSPPLVIMSALAYLLMLRHSLSRVFVITIAALILLEIAAHTLWGSRSAIVALVQLLVVVGLALWGVVRLPRKLVILGAVAAPFLATLLVAMFTISTYNRAARDVGNLELDVGRAVESAAEAGTDLFAGPAVDSLLPPVLARAGFFDFAAEIIANGEAYAPLFNAGSYSRSIVDNILTPGFDVYDQPKLSNAMRFEYIYGGVPSKDVVASAYHSDQFTIYGEFYALFGYFSLLPMFGVVAAAKYAYLRLRSPNPYVLALKRVFVLYLFWRLLDSFGIDWVISDAVPLAVAMFLYSRLFTAQPIDSRADAGG